MSERPIAKVKCNNHSKSRCGVNDKEEYGGKLFHFFLISAAFIYSDIKVKSLRLYLL